MILPSFLLSSIIDVSKYMEYMESLLVSMPSKGFLDGIDNCKDIFLDRAEVMRTVPRFLSAELSVFDVIHVNSKVRAWIVPVPGEFHASEAAHLVAAADQNGDEILSKEEVGSQKPIFSPFVSPFTLLLG